MDQLLAYAEKVQATPQYKSIILQHSATTKAVSGECFDNPEYSRRLALVFGYELPQGNACQMLHAAGACEGAYRSLAAVLCPHSCGFADDDATIASLAAQVAPAAGIPSCEALPSFLGSDTRAVCFGNEYSNYIRRYCPCLCQRASLEQVGIPPEEPEECRPWVSFFDSFDGRADNTRVTGQFWSDAMSSAGFLDQRMCGRDQAGVFAATCEIPEYITWQYQWASDSETGFTLYNALVSPEGYIGIVGCDGGIEGFCAPTIAVVRYGYPIYFQQLDLVPLNPNEIYVSYFAVSEDYVSFYLLDFDPTLGYSTSVLSELYVRVDKIFGLDNDADTDTEAAEPVQVPVFVLGGVIMGGGDPRSITCIDNFQMYVWNGEKEMDAGVTPHQPVLNRRV